MEFIRLYNNLHESVLNGSTEEMQATKIATVRSLLDYASYHFEYEEKIFEEIDFPERAKHRMQHQFFKDKIHALHEEMSTGQMILSTSMLKMLRNWIANHIATEDGRIKEYMKKPD